VATLCLKMNKTAEQYEELFHYLIEKYGIGIYTIEELDVLIALSVKVAEKQELVILK
jgi:hypothetical protein